MVDALLSRQSTNLIALLAQARLQFARRAHSAAFETYQCVLGLKPDMSPDPRIGLGICAWVAGDKVRAKMAWEKALKRVRLIATSLKQLRSEVMAQHITSPSRAL
jgi:RNA polymerase-associated protein CTR9